MRRLAAALRQEPEFQRLLAAIDGGACPAVYSGTSAVHRAHAAAAIRILTQRPVVLVAADDGEAERLAADLSGFLEAPVPVLTGRDFVFYNAESVSRQAEQRRLGLLYAWQREQLPAAVATLDGLAQRTLPPAALSEAVQELRMGEPCDLEALTAGLIRAGYTRCEQVEGCGQFALRGGILDVFSPAYAQPMRAEFFGDDIDSMGFFDVGTQRRTEQADRFLILPAAETLPTLYPEGPDAFAAALEALAAKLEKRKNTRAELPDNIRRDAARLRERRSFPAADRYMELLYPMASAADYLPADAVVLLSEPKRLEERAKNYAWQLGEDVTALAESGILEGSLARFAADFDDICKKLEDFAVVMADNFTSSEYPLRPRALTSVTTQQLPSYGGSLETAAEDIAHYLRTGVAVAVLCTDRRRAELLQTFLRERNVACGIDLELAELPGPGACRIAQGSLSAGFVYPELGLAVITEGQLSQPTFRRKARRHADGVQRRKLESFTDLSPGDLVVHEQYGIGRFVGIFQMTVDKAVRDYIKIAYAGTDVLYVPATQLDAVSKYIGGGEDQQVRLSKMGGTDWVKAKARAKGAAKDLAQGLIQLQAERRRRKGYAFAPDTPWQAEFEEAFGFEETDDQLRSVREIKADMERPVPMDRLLCGDVGYGKTEVALRAVMKCVMEGKQAAILVPTTVLAQQHYTTVMKRFSGYPVQVEVLSRFRTQTQMKKAVKAIGEGTVDIVIGTHRILQKDLHFKDLGLLVVDEEQRFGVVHKERLKEMARQVDVLTLSATPIPRTLNMALSGLRDMSTIEEPPQDRQPVQTYVLEHDWSVVCDAIRREVGRGGQVYYLHNRVETIDRTAARLASMLEDVRFGVAHGKMDEEQLSAVMESMADGEIQVLVCTTIIETGIDIPNVNTLIIEDADRLGLAQLHQIRGRVGRSARRAFAYLTFRQGKILTEVAQKRLSAIREFAAFNSGFKIAMRDLEIRGAGNLLGAEQSGHMMRVGYDMYLKLLEEAVLEEQGEKVPVRTECPADLLVSANIPERYVPSAEQRMDLYRRIAHIRSEADADDMTDELIDRFGDPPKSVNTLIYIAVLRGEAAAAGVTEIAQRQSMLVFKLADFDMQTVSALYALPAYKGLLKIEAGSVPAVSLRLREGREIVGQALQFVRDYRSVSGGE